MATDGAHLTLVSVHDRHRAVESDGHTDGAHLALVSVTIAIVQLKSDGYGRRLSRPGERHDLHRAVEVRWPRTAPTSPW